MNTTLEITHKLPPVKNSPPNKRLFEGRKTFDGQRKNDTGNCKSIL